MGILRNLAGIPNIPGPSDLEGAHYVQHEKGRYKETCSHRPAVRVEKINTDWQRHDEPGGPRLRNVEK